MSAQPTTKFAMIVVAVILMVALVWTLGNSLSQESHDAITQDTGPIPEPATIRAEQAVFQGATQASRFAGVNAPSVRTMETYYSRRAFPGAPPMIPHAVEATMVTDFESCLGCHEKGGFAQVFNAYAPVTPHPEFTNCRQCHLPQNVQTLFVNSDWQFPTPPKLGQSALAGSPPPIPHTLQLRENCSACHSGPAVAPAIRTSHPERIYCRQCHVPSLAEAEFTR